MRWLLVMGMVSCGPLSVVSDADTDGPADTDGAADTDDTDVTDTEADTDTDADTDSDTDTDTDTSPSSALLEELLPMGDGGLDSVDASREWAVQIAPGAATIEVVELWLRGTGDTDTDLVVEIHDGATGVPSGTALASITVDGATIPEKEDWVVVNLPRGVEVGTGASFVVLRTTGGRASFTGFPQATTESGQLAVREVPGAWELLGKPYDWAHRVWGVAK